MIDNSRRAVYEYDQRIEVFGSEGMLVAENVSNFTIVYYNKDHVEMKKSLPIFTERYKDAYINEAIYFVRSVLYGDPIVCTGEDVLLTQRIAIAAQKSLETGMPVKVDQAINELIYA